MAIGTPTARGSGTSTTNNTTVTATLATGSANRWIIGIAAKRDNVAATGTFSGAGLTWTTVDFNNAATTGGVHVGWALDTAGTASGTVTFTWASSATRKGISLWEVTGLDLTAPHDAIDTANSGTSGNASVTAGSATTQASEIIFFVSKHNAASGTVTGTPSTGYTELDDFIVGASTWVQQYSSYKITSATETPAPSVTFSDTTTNWQCGVIAFKAAASGTNATMTFTPSVVTATPALIRQPLHILTTGLVTASAALARQPSRIFTPNVATTSAALNRTPLKPFTASIATASAVLNRQPQKLFTTTTATATATFSAIKVKVVAFTTSIVSASAALVRQPAHTFATNSATASVGLRKTPVHVFATSIATASASFSAIKVKVVTFTTSLVTASATLTRTPAHSLAASASATASIAKLISRSFAPNLITATATITKQPRRLLSAAANLVASLVTLKISGGGTSITQNFTSAPSAGVSDDPTQTEYTDAPQAGASSDPSQGRFG